MIKKYWKCIIVWFAMMCGIGSMIFHSFLQPIVGALIGFIGLGILVAAIMCLLNKM